MKVLNRCRMSELTQQCGIEVVELMEKIKAEVRCGICCSTLSDPVVTTCNHLFCHDCFQQCLRKLSQMSCPICKQSLNRRSCVRSPQHARIVHAYLKLAAAFKEEISVLGIPKDQDFMESQAVNLDARAPPPAVFLLPQLPSKKGRGSKRQNSDSSTSSSTGFSGSGTAAKKPALEEIREEEECREKESRDTTPSLFGSSHGSAASTRGTKMRTQKQKEEPEEKENFVIVDVKPKMEPRSNAFYERRRGSQARESTPRQAPSPMEPAIQPPSRIQINDGEETLTVEKKDVETNTKSREFKTTAVNTDQNETTEVGVETDKEKGERQQLVADVQELIQAHRARYSILRRRPDIDVLLDAMPNLREVIENDWIRLHQIFGAVDCPKREERDRGPFSPNASLTEAFVERRTATVSTDVVPSSGTAEAREEEEEEESSRERRAEREDQLQQQEDVVQETLDDSIRPLIIPERLQSPVRSVDVTETVVDSIVPSQHRCSPRPFDSTIVETLVEELVADTLAETLLPAQEEPRPLIVPRAQNNANDSFEDSIVLNEPVSTVVATQRKAEEERVIFEDTLIECAIPDTADEQAELEERQEEKPQLLMSKKEESGKSDVVASSYSHEGSNLKLIVSGKKDGDEKLLSDFKSQFPAVTFSETSSPDNNLLILLDSDGRIARKRSLKYVYAIAHGTEVVGRAWMEESVMQKSILDTKPYGITGSRDGSENAQAWQKARDWNAEGKPGLLSCYTVLVNPRYMKTDVPGVEPKSFADMLKAIGATVVDKVWRITDVPNTVVLFSSESKMMNEAKRVEQDTKAMAVTVNWLVDSVSEWEAQPLEAYRVAKDDAPPLQLTQSSKFDSSFSSTD